MGKLVVHTDEVRGYLKDMLEHYAEQEESIENHMKLLDEASSLLAAEDLTAVNYELDAIKDKGNEYVGDKMPDVHDILDTVKPINPYIEAISTINQFIYENDIPTFNQTIRQIQPFNRTTETVDGVSMQDVIQGAGEISGAYDLYRAYGMTDPVTGEKLGYDEWLIAVGWTILMITPARLLKGAGKVGSAAKGTMSTRAAKALQSQEKLSSLTDLSKAASLQSVNKAKQMSKKQIERVEEMLDRYADMFGPNYVPAMGGAGAGGTYRFADGNYMAFNIEETGAGKSVATVSNAQAQQRAAIESVESGEVALKTNKQKGNYGEMKMDDYFESQGYERISNDRVTGLDDKLSKGIDGVYENANHPPKYVIAEAKYNTAQLSNTKRSGRQMSDKWIDGENRLIEAVGMNKNGRDNDRNYVQSR